MSRIKNLEDLFLIGTYTARAIKENVAAKLGYEQMSNNQIKFLPKLMISDFSLTITLLNIRSIKAHMLDVLSDQHLIGSDFLCLTETPLQRHDDLDHSVQTSAKKLSAT